MALSIKECFISRWGDDGVIMEADYSQLEVIGAAIVSGDEMMKKDIRDGVDSHSQSAAWLNPTHTYQEILEGYLAEDPYYTKLRKNAKAPRFELQYGAGATSIARNNGISKEAAQGFIDRYYDRYKRLKQFQEEVANEVAESRINSGEKCPNGYPKGIGYYVSITGRIYCFEEYPAPKWMQEQKGIYTSFSPTQMKNYPLQGFATGDIVPEMLGRLHSYLAGCSDDFYEKVLPTNTVHDSVILDVHKDVLSGAAVVVRDVLQSAPACMEQRFGVKIDLPLHVDVEVGPNWAEVKKWKF